MMGSPIEYVDAERLKKIEDQDLCGIQEVGWYFWDETGTMAYGPYETAEETHKKLNEYAETL